MHVNGIGERAGNCSLEEFVMVLKTRRDLLGLDTGIDTTHLVPVSRLVSRTTHSPVVRNKAVVGKNAFAHEAGIHQHGVMNDARTYEVMRPQDVGMSGTELVLGKHSGRHAVGKRARDLGFALDDAALTAAFAAFKTRADDIGELDDDELRAILTRSRRADAGWRLARLETRVEGARPGPRRRHGRTRRGRGRTVEPRRHCGLGARGRGARHAARQRLADVEIDEIETLHTGFGATPRRWPKYGRESRGRLLPRPRPRAGSRCGPACAPPSTRSTAPHESRRTMRARSHATEKRTAERHEAFS